MVEKRVPHGGTGFNSNNEVVNYIDYLANLDRSVCKDDNSFSIKTVDYDRYLINQGRMFQSGNVYSSLAFNNKITSLFKSPINYKTHLKNFIVSAEGATLKATIFKDVTYKTGTRVANVPNLNANYNDYYSNNYIHGEIFALATYENGVIWKAPNVIHGSTTNQSIGSSGLASLITTELITKNDGSFYAIEIENIDQNSDTAHNIQISFMFYDTEC